MLGTRSLGIWIPGRGIQYFHSKYRLPALLIWMTVCITFGMVVCAPLLNAVICYFTSGEWTDNVAQLGPIKLTFRLTDKATCENHPWWIRLLGWALSWARTCDANGDGEVDLGEVVKQSIKVVIALSVLFNFTSSDALINLYARATRRRAAATPSRRNNLGDREWFPDYGEAVRRFRKKAEQGHRLSQFNMGVAYEHGKGVAKDNKKAARWHRKSAEQGFAPSQRNLGVMYYYGRGVAQDDGEAVRWLRKAAEQGDADAQFNLGSLYDEGQGAMYDEGRAAATARAGRGGGGGTES